MSDAGAQIIRLEQVVARLRVDCPWDAEQTHESLVKHLIEETAEVVEAVEIGSPDDLREELGDLLMQVVYHAQLASEDAQFDLGEVTARIADKLIHRHPYVFGDAGVPDDLEASWEARKRVDKHRDSSLDGIPVSLPSLARAGKVISRIRQAGLPIPLDDRAITPDEVGNQLLALVARAQASGVDADQALRAALRSLEQGVRQVEAPTNHRPDGSASD